MKTHILIGPIIAVILWWILHETQLFSSFLLPNPWTVTKEFLSIIKDIEILRDMLATLSKTFFAISTAAIIGIPLGLLLGRSQTYYESVEFLIDFLRSTPAAAMFPLFLLFFGIGDVSKIALAAFASFVIILFNTAHGVMNASKERMLAVKIMGATSYQQFKHVLLWESLPQTLIGLKSALSVSLVLIVVTEMFIGTTNGLGKKIIDAQISYQIPNMYAIILLTGTMGYLLNKLINFGENKFIRWQITDIK